MPRLLAIDYGARRVGLAVGDTESRLAAPLRVLEIGSPQQAAEMILPMIEEEGADALVVGLPLNMDGSIGPAAHKTAQWARDLSRRADRPLMLVDERLSSYAAEQQLIERKRAGESLSRKRKKKRLDALAAAGFLQAYLDGTLKAIELNP